MRVSQIPKTLLISLRAEGLTVNEMAAEVGCSPGTIKKACKLNGVSLLRPAAVRVCAYCKGPKAGPAGLYCSVECHQAQLFDELYVRFIAGEPIKGSSRLFRRLVRRRDGVCCDTCKNSEWCGQEIPLELEHIDGNSENNAASNLKLLCPNCHALTPTYKIKNKGNGRHSRRERYSSGLSY